MTKESYDVKVEKVFDQIKNIISEYQQKEGDAPYIWSFLVEPESDSRLEESVDGCTWGVKVGVPAMVYSVGKDARIYIFHSLSKYARIYNTKDGTFSYGALSKH